MPKTNHGAILLTSRDNSLVRQFGGADVAELDEESAVQLLKRLSKFDEIRLTHGELSRETPAAYEIVRRIGCFPLGISQASNLILNDNCLLTEFLRGYENEDLITDSQDVQILGRKASEYQHSLGTVWDMNFKRLTADEQSLLYLLAFLDPDRFQVRLLTDGAAGSEATDFKFINSQRKIYKCKSALLRSSLVRQSSSLEDPGSEVNEDLRELRMHRLVQASCHVRMSENERRQYFRLAVRLMGHCWPVANRHATYDPSLWPTQRAYLPHVQSLCKYYEASCMADDPLIPYDEIEWGFPRLLYEAGWYVIRPSTSTVQPLIEAGSARSVDYTNPYRPC